MPFPDRSALESLRALPNSTVLLAGDAGYDTARQAWNSAVDQRPAAVVIPRDIADIVELVTIAAGAGLRVAPQSTGHGAGPFHRADLDDVVLVRLSELTGVEVDADACTVRVTGGTLWREVLAATLPHGLIPAHGSAADVAVAGYVLGGGLSFYARKHGLTSDGVRAIELVDAQGALVRASREENAELFWALRGAGGAFGIVTTIELELLPYPEVFTGMLLWDRERAPEVVRAWAAWNDGVPDSVTTSLRLMSFPPAPELPPFLSGRDIVVIDGVVLEDDEEAARLLAPLRALSPELDTFARVPSDAVLAVHLDPPVPTPAVSDHALLRGLPEEAIVAFLAAAQAGGLTFAELRQLGGALAAGAPAGGQLSAVRADYLLFAVAAAETPELAERGTAAATAFVQALAPWSSSRLLPTFSETAVAPARIYGEDLDRLVELAGRLDPDGLFLGNHPLRVESLPAH